MMKIRTCNTRALQYLIGVQSKQCFILSIFPAFIVAIVICIAPSVAEGQDKPLWQFSILASIDEVFIEQFGGLENCDSLIRTQLDSINHIYNDPGVFEGKIEFYLDSLQPFSQSGFTQAHQPHPDQDYHIVYDFDTQTLFNWLYPPDNAVLYRTFSTYEVPFPFITQGNLVLAHELAHSRGAVDLYGLEVAGSFNDVNEMSFTMPGSYMSDLMTGVWSEHTIAVINKNAGVVLSEEQFHLAIFPDQMVIRVVDSLQRPVMGADITIYGHTWYDMYISDEILGTGITNWRGEYFLPENMFIGYDPGNVCPNPLCLRYSTLLLKIKFDEYEEYLWIPFTGPQTHAINHNPGAFVETVKLPFVYDGPGDDPNTAGRFTLNQNFPNPFNSETLICITLPSEGQLRLEITNLLGQTTAILHNSSLSGGTTCFMWDGQAPSGIYFCHAYYSGNNQSVKMLLIK